MVLRHLRDFESHHDDGYVFFECVYAPFDNLGQICDAYDDIFDGVSYVVSLASVASRLGWLESVEVRLERLISRAIRAGVHVLLVRQSDITSRFLVHPGRLHVLFDDLLDFIGDISSILYGSTQVKSTSRSFVLDDVPSSVQFGRPAKMTFGSIACDLLREYYSSRVSAHARITNDTLYKNGTATITGAKSFVNRALTELSLPLVSRSLVYNGLMPARSNTHEAYRHSPFALNVRPLRPSRDGKNVFRCDDHFCCAQGAKAIELVHLLGSDAIGLSRDDRRRIPPFDTSSSGSCRRSWVFVDNDVEAVRSGESLPVHSFAAVSSLSIVPTSVLELSLVTPANMNRRGPLSQRGGHAYVVLKAQVTTPSNASHLADVLLHSLIQRAKRLRGFVPNVEGFPSVCFLFVDGGTDETMRAPVNRVVFALVSLILDLDALVVIKWSPDGGSKYNPVEVVNGVIGLIVGNAPLIDSEFAMKTFGINVERLPVKLDDAKVRDIVSVALARILERFKSTTTTFSGLPVHATAWPLDNALHFLPDEWRAVDASLRAAGRNRFPAALVGVRIPVTQRIHDMRSSLGLRCLERASIPVDELHRLAIDEQHSFLSEHMYIVGRCGISGCSVCSGANRGIGGMASMLLGDSNRVGALRALLVPVRDVSRDGEHYEGLDDALRQRAARIAAAPPDITPSRIVHDWVQAAFAQHKFKPTDDDLHMLGAQCNYSRDNPSFAQFKRYVSDALAAAHLAALEKESKKSKVG